MIARGTADWRGLRRNGKRDEARGPLREPGALTGLGAEPKKLRAAPRGALEIVQAPLQRGSVGISCGQTQKSFIAVHKGAQNPFPVGADFGARAEILEHAMAGPGEERDGFGLRMKSKERKDGQNPNDAREK